MRLEVVLVLREEVVDVVEEVAWRVVEDCVYIGNIFLKWWRLESFLDLLVGCCKVIDCV